MSRHGNSPSRIPNENTATARSTLAPTISRAVNTAHSKATREGINTLSYSGALSGCPKMNVGRAIRVTPAKHNTRRIE
ncbi:hypothetical protein AC249_AIPGENE7386 [Exaiptasia diaphana]|nr:hypothetical protein AC249_AIPGENE7386 [Exaiptasia diaphana]